MTKTNKTGWVLMGVLASLSCLSGNAWADPVPGNNSGSFIIRITPNLDLGVSVDTNGAAWLGSSDLSVTANLATQERLGTPVTLTILGDFNNQELTLIVAALDTWVVDETVATVDDDSVQIFALVGRDQTGTLATLADYDTGLVDHLITTSAKRVGQPELDEPGETANNTFEFKPADGVLYDDADTMIVGTVRKLWISARTPNLTSEDGEMRFQITVEATTGAGL